jgi:hypothetical protein
VVGDNEQPLGNQLDRHPREVRQNLVKPRGYRSKVIDDDDRGSSVDRHVPKQTGIGVEAAG